MSQFSGKSVWVTSADRYMGPSIADEFERLGAIVTRDTHVLYDDHYLLETLADIPDIVIANLAEPPRKDALEAIQDDDWNVLFDHLVHPLMRIIRHVSGPMKARGYGKIVAITSAAPLRGIPFASGYCAARGAQNAFIKGAGLELAKFGVQANAIGQNYIENDTYYPPELMQDPRFISSLSSQVPTKKVGRGLETAKLAAYLADPDVQHVVGQIIPLAGGWTT
ncbi:SDR family oxidoreductase [Aequoribacter sp.]|uniref:SDR family oxidoreductase n=1 Tax=Aequoribacter sp. TaxID=2847771 RepID=UPI003F695B47